jgi:hypothetical protein
MKDYADQDWINGDRSESWIEAIAAGIGALALLALAFLSLVLIGA